jgi:hypothetical protein
MSTTDRYFTFPLAILNGVKSEPYTTPYSCIDLALDCGILGAGKGYRHNHGADAFRDRLDEVCDKRGLSKGSRPAAHTEKAEILVGAALCGVTLGSTNPGYLERMADRAGIVTRGGPLVTMKGGYFWAAFYQARAEVNPINPWPDRGVSWREFRILCAILSVKTNRVGYATLGWETIQARSCGFTTKESFRTADTIPDHLAPPLSRKQIRATCDALEDLGFFARFRLSIGPVGGHTAYSFRHDRDALANAVCDNANFRDRARIRENRAKDAAKCLQMLERAKSGPSEGQGRGQVGAKSGPT